MTNEEKVRLGIQKMLTYWKVSRGDCIVHLNGEDLEFAIVSEGSDHILEVSLGDDYYKIKIYLEVLNAI